MTFRPFVLLALIVPLGALGACASSTSPTTTDATEHDTALQEYTNRQVVKYAFDAWAAGTGGPFDLLTPDATWTITGDSRFSKTYHGKEQFMSEIIRPFNARMLSPLVPTVEAIESKGDTVTVRFFGRGIALDHQPYNNTYVWRMRMRDEQVVDVVATFDLKTLENLWTRVQPAS